MCWDLLVHTILHYAGRQANCLVESSSPRPSLTEFGRRRKKKRRRRKKKKKQQKRKKKRRRRKKKRRRRKKTRYQKRAMQGVVWEKRF